MAMTVNHSRMSAEQAQAALEQVETQLAAHAKGCKTCAAAWPRGAWSLWATWRFCADGAAMVRTHQSVMHRINYLAQRDRARARQTREDQE